nr:RNA-directed DNA polymerase, eukaryota [Tanacetum cinerariifolium]
MVGVVFDDDVAATMGLRRWWFGCGDVGGGDGDKGMMKVGMAAASGGAWQRGGDVVELDAIDEVMRWQRETIVIGDFNEVCVPLERYGSVFNKHGASMFNSFINSSSLIDVPTWAIKNATKMSKLDRFLVSEGLLCQFPAITGLILTRHLSDHRPIILKECDIDYGPIPFKMFHSWFDIDSFDQMVKDAWQNEVVVDLNEMRKEIQEKLHNLDKQIDQDGGQEDLLNPRRDLWKDLRVLNDLREKDLLQKAKVKWAIEGNENSKYFHGTINKRRHQMAIRGISVNGDPNHCMRFHNDEMFTVSLNQSQQEMLEVEVADMEIKKAVWDCGKNKSPGPDGMNFEFIRKFWDVIGGDVCRAVKEKLKKGQTRIKTGQKQEALKKNLKKDKLESKPDKNGKRGEAGKSQKQLQ